MTSFQFRVDMADKNSQHHRLPEHFAHSLEGENVKTMPGFGKCGSVAALFFSFVLGFQFQAQGDVIHPTAASTSAPISNGATANVIDGVVDASSYLQLGPQANGSFAGPYSVTFTLGGAFNLTGMSLWNNAGLSDQVTGQNDGEGIASFSLTLLDSSDATIGTFGGTAADTFAQQDYAFAGANVAKVQLTINSNHQAITPRQYVNFHEIAFTGTPVPEPMPSSALALLLASSWLAHRR
jgi:hypothetical protein